MRGVEENESQALPLWPETVMGGKFVRLLQNQLNELRGSNAHGNRELFLDDVFVAYLLAFFNPTIRSLRTLEDFSQTRQAQKHLSIAKICRSTLSDFNRLADPERLQPLLQALRTSEPQGTADGPAGSTRTTTPPDDCCGRYIPARRGRGGLGGLVPQSERGTEMVACPARRAFSR